MIAFVILFALGFTLEEPTALAVGAVEKDTPAAAQLQRGDRLESINGVARGDGTAEAQADRLTGALDDLECAGPTTDGCEATTAIPVVVVRDGERKTLEMRPFYDSEVDRFRFGFGFEGVDFVAADHSVSGSADFAVDADVGRDLADGHDRDPDLRRRAARADQRHRRLVRDHPPVDRVRHPPGAVRDRADQPLARA